MKKKSSFSLLKLLKNAAIVLLFLILLLIFYLAVILGLPQQTADQDQTPPAALLPAGPAKIEEVTELPELLEGFPAAALTFLSGSGLDFAYGEAESIIAGDSSVRRISLHYTLPDTQAEILLESCYPVSAADAVAREDYILSSPVSWSIAGLSAVRMDSPSRTRFHALANHTLYVITLPRLEQKAMAEHLRSLQLVSLKKSERSSAEGE